MANWIIGAIIGVFFYAKAAHDNTPKENQGNPLKWNWLPWNWGKPDEVVFHFGSNTDGSGMYGGISAEKQVNHNRWLVIAKIKDWVWGTIIMGIRTYIIHNMI